MGLSYNPTINTITVTGLKSKTDLIVDAAAVTNAAQMASTQDGDLNIQYFGEFDAARRQYIYSYSFALSPEEHQPSGTCNMSRIDNATLQLQLTPKSALGSKIRVYATNYNVLRIMSGMGGLAYSN